MDDITIICSQVEIESKQESFSYNYSSFLEINQ